jgi:DnaJ-class molecular chaperone
MNSGEGPTNLPHKKWQDYFSSSLNITHPQSWKPDDTLYGRLQILRTATQDEIKAAYRLRSLQIHPDKQSSTLRDIAQTEFQSLQKAYEILSNPQLRKVYDLYGLRGVENHNALVECTVFKDPDNPTLIELILGAGVYNEKKKI